MMKRYRVIINRLLIQLLILIFFSSGASAQSAKEMKAIFAQAESYYLFEEYELANQLYILLETPDNFNIKYKIGTCYLSIPGEKGKAIPYLEEAVKNASYEARVESFNEKRASLDAYFYLAKAYMINNELDKGLATLQTFDRLSKGAEVKDMENIEFIRQQIEACNNAIELAKNPVYIRKEMLGGDFALGSLNEYPAVSFDGKSIAYTERRGLTNVIFYARKNGDAWQNPVDITSAINAGEDCTTCSLNGDGTELFLYKTDGFDGNIYSTKLVNNNWTPIRKLNKNINTKFYESHASVSADGKKLYFTSNREDGIGSLDIYVSDLDASGDWGPAVNLGNTINTPYNEDTPFITKDNKLLYFSSEGHLSMGGYDNFVSVAQGGSWKTPENLAAPINSTDDDKFYQPVNNGDNAYYSIVTDYKKKDIFYISFGRELFYYINGLVTLSDTTASPVIPVALLTNKESGDTVILNSQIDATGKFSATVRPGEYAIKVTAPGYIEQVRETILEKNLPDTLVNLSIVLQREIDTTVYEKIVLANIPTVQKIDSAILVMNMSVSDINDTNVADSDILYFTVQVMALYNPVDVSYFRYISDIKVIFNQADKFYRYTTGQFKTNQEASAYRRELLRKGYPDEIFIKKVSTK